MHHNIVPIHILLKKLYRRFLLRKLTLLFNHIISSILSLNSLNMPNRHNLSIDLLTPKQRLCMKSALIDMDNKHNELIPSFSFYHEEFRPGNYLIDSFSDRFSFHQHSSNIKKHMEELDSTTLRVSSNTSSAIVISNTSIKNHVATSISHIYSHNRPITKTIHRMANVSTTKAELFVIWCGINQAVSVTNVNYIVIVMDSLHTTKKIFDSSFHPYQIHSAAILSELREFLSRNANNCIEFWDCPSKQKWPLHVLVNKDSKSFEFTLSFSYKSSWDYYSKRESDLAISQWRMYFQAADSRGKSFFDL